MWDGLKNNLSYELPSAQWRETESNWIYFLTFFYSNINITPEHYKLLAVRMAFVCTVPHASGQDFVHTLKRCFFALSANIPKVFFFPWLNKISFQELEVWSCFPHLVPDKELSTSVRAWDVKIGVKQRIQLVLVLCVGGEEGRFMLPSFYVALCTTSVHHKRIFFPT